MGPLSRGFYLKLYLILQSYNLITTEIVMIWANPISLATTLGITIVFFSSG